MANPVQILDALERVDPASAQVLATSVLLDLTNEAFDDVVKAYGPQMVSLVDDMTNRWRAEAGGSYVHEIAKSADPVAAAAAASRFTEAIADAMAVREALLFEIGKSERDEQWNDPLGGGTVRRRVRRDAKGRFTRSISSQSSDITSWRRPQDKKASRRARPLPSNIEQAVQPARDDGSGVAWDPMVLADDDQKMKYERYLGQIAQVDDLRRELATAFRGSKRADEMLSVDLRLRDAATGQMETQNVPLTGGLDDFAWDPNREAVEVQYGPSEELDQQQADKVRAQLALQALPGLGAGGLDPQLLANLGSMIESGTLTARNYDDSKTKRLRRFAESTANTLQMVPVGGAQQAADYVRNAADVLGSAEELKEPMSRAAYRMRGTTRTPDRNLVESVQGDRLGPKEQRLIDDTVGLQRPVVDYASEVEEQYRPRIKQLAADKNNYFVNRNGVTAPKGELLRLMNEYDGKKKKALSRMEAARTAVSPQDFTDKERNSAVTNALVSRLAAGESGEQAVRGAQRDAAAMYFVDQMIESTASRNKDSGRVNFNRLSDQVAFGIGRGFPSEGVIIDSGGKVVAQAVGIAEDHYLPFDMANYKNLNGGSYVRTRTLGGLTSEDMRSMLLGNARAATVVSASGVFDIELDPKLRGGRRYNDKVARIPEMYDRILDEIANGGHYAVDLGPMERDEIDQQVAQWVSFTPNASEEQIKTKRRELTDQKRKQLEQLTTDDRANAKSKAEEIVAQENVPASQRAAAVEEETSRQLKAIKREKVRALKVNGEGYDLAAKTLQRYFPYYIRSVSHRPLQQLSEEVVGNRTNAASARALDVDSDDKWRVRPGQNLRNPERLKLRDNPTRDWNRGESKAEEESGTVATGTPPATPEAKQQEKPESEATAPVAQAPKPDIGGSAKVEQEAKAYFARGVNTWGDELLESWDPQLASNLDQSLATRLRDREPLDVLKDPNTASSSAGVAFLAALRGDSVAAGEAIMLLGSDGDLRQKVASDASAEGLAKLLGNPADPDELDQIRKILFDQFDRMTRLATVMASDWTKPSGSVVVDFLQGKAQPVAMPELAVTSQSELTKFDTAELAGLSAGVRNTTMMDLPIESSVVEMAMRPKAAAQAAVGLRSRMADGKISEQMDTAEADKILDELLTVDGDEYADNTRSYIKRALSVLATESGAQIPQNELARTVLNNPALLDTVSKAAIAQYSLLVRRMQLEFGDSPKAKAAFPAAKQPSPSPVGKSLDLEALRVAKRQEWAGRYGTPSLLQH